MAKIERAGALKRSVILAGLDLNQKVFSDRHSDRLQTGRLFAKLNKSPYCYGWLPTQVTADNRSTPLAKPLRTPTPLREKLLGKYGYEYGDNCYDQ